MTDSVRVTIGGGMTEVGCRNATIIEYHTRERVYKLPIDWGQKIPNADDDQELDEYVAIHGDLPDEYYPDSSYLAECEVPALIFTHGHLDHIGGAHRIHAMYPNAEVITDPFTAKVIELQDRKARRKGIPADNLRFETVVDIPPFRVRRFPVNHSIIGASGVVVEVGGRRIVHLGDLKSWPVRRGYDRNLEVFGGLRELGKIDLVFTDATNAQEPGFVISELVVQERLKSILEMEKRRVFTTGISSNTRRHESCIDCAQGMGRPVYVGGRSMSDYLRIAGVVGWQGLIPQRDRRYLEPSPSSWAAGSVICVTGSQGEPNSFLGRMADGRINIPTRRGDALVNMQDTIPVPDAEESFIYTMEGMSGRVDRMHLTWETPEIKSRGAEIVRYDDLHSSGHGKQGCIGRYMGYLGWPLSCPGHADLAKREAYATIARESGGEVVLLEDGESIVL